MTYKWCKSHENHLRLQTGATGVHIRLRWQVLVSEPTSTKPALQMYHTSAPTPLPCIIFTRPFFGSSNSAHCRAACMYEVIILVTNFFKNNWYIYYYKWCMSHENNLRLQTGAAGTHARLRWQVLVSEPTSTKPALQMYHTLAPTPLPCIIYTRPFSGSSNSVHCCAACVINECN